MKSIFLFSGVICAIYRRYFSDKKVLFNSKYKYLIKLSSIFINMKNIKVIILFWYLFAFFSYAIEISESVRIFGNYGKIQNLAIDKSGKVLAFSSDYRDGKGDIIIYDIEKKIKKTITRKDSLESQPVFSKDGRYIFYFSSKGKQGGIWKIPRKGGEPERITDEKYWCEFPSISQNGRRLVYYSRRGSSYNLYELNIATKKEKQLTTGDKFDFGPVYIKNDSSVVFYSNRTDTFSLFLLNLATNKILSLRGPGGFTFQPTIDTDGKYIFAVSNKRGQNNIYAVSLNGAESIPITKENSPDLFPVNDPERNRLFFISQREGDFAVYMLKYKF